MAKLRDKITMEPMRDGPSLPVYFGLLLAGLVFAMVVSGLIVGWPW